MLKTIFKISWLNLKRDLVALGLSFVLPIVFFSIFASIFSNTGTKDAESGGMKKLHCLAVDEDQSRISQRFVSILKDEPNLDLLDQLTDQEDGLLTREQAWKSVRSGNMPIALVFPKGFGEHFGAGKGAELPVELIYDPSDMIAKFAVSGILQGVAMKAAPDVFMEKGMSFLDTYGGGLTEKQKEAIAMIKPFMQGEKAWEDIEDGTESHSGPNQGTLVAIKNTNVQIVQNPDSGEKIGSGSMVSYYVAAIGVMFLLFSMSGAAGSILEEEENGTLERVLTSSLGMMSLLLGKWIFYCMLGFIQVLIMFIWASIFFDLPLWTPYYLTGCVLITLVTASAAAAFGILLAVICRSRAQLSGISTVVILVMSAMGGSMVPRMLMPEFMQKVGKFTFNGQALDGYLNIFWHYDPALSAWRNLGTTWPQVLILTAMTLVCLGLARFFARRWEKI